MKSQWDHDQVMWTATEGQGTSDHIVTEPTNINFIHQLNGSQTQKSNINKATKTKLSITTTVYQHSEYMSDSARATSENIWYSTLLDRVNFVRNFNLRPPSNQSFYFRYAEPESTFREHVQWSGSEDLHKDLVYSKFQWPFLHFINWASLFIYWEGALMQKALSLVFVLGTTH